MCRDPLRSDDRDAPKERLIKIISAMNSPVHLSRIEAKRSADAHYLHKRSGGSSRLRATLSIGHARRSRGGEAALEASVDRRETAVGHARDPADRAEVAPTKRRGSFGRRARDSEPGLHLDC